MNSAILRGVVAVAVLASCVAPVRAAAIVGGSSLLSAAYADQLESWLGEGAITLTNIYTKKAGDRGADFHGAVDNKGRTFVVIYGTEANTGASAVFGGYDPDSWNSWEGWHLNAAVADRKSFLFNLTDAKRYDQRTTAFTGGSWNSVDSGQYQAYNSGGYGPAFGGGHDIFVNDTLDLGYSFLWSYTDDNAPTYPSKSIVDGSAYNGMDLRIGGIEVFTIGEAASVPEPGSIALAGLALSALAVAGRRRAGPR